MNDTDKKPASGNAEAQEPKAPERFVKKTTKSLGELERGLAHYPEPVITEAKWMQGFYFERCQSNIMSLRSIAAKLGHDKSEEYFYNLIGGHYFTNKVSTWVTGGRAWSEFLEMVAALRRYEVQASRMGKLPFIQTPTYFCIEQFITAKRSPSAVCRIGGIIAPTGGQTSESFKFYQSLNNHGMVTHVEAPANGRLTALQSKILEQYHVSGCKIERRRELSLRDNINELRTIIIDNAQVLFSAKHGNDQPCFNWIREIYDDRRPTFILKFTEEFLDDMARESARGYFEQFIGRMGGMQSLLRLPDYAPEADLKCIAAAFKIESKAGADLLHKWSRQLGRIRIVFDKLQLAQTFSETDGRKRITLDDLQEADKYVPPSIGTFEGGAS